MGDRSFLINALVQCRDLIDSIEPLTESDWRMISPLYTEQTLKKGECFCEEGEYAPNLAFVYEGVLRSYVVSDEVLEYNKDFFDEGKFAISYTAAMTNQKSLLTIQALTDVKLIVANFQKLHSFFDQSPTIERMVRKYVEFGLMKKERRDVEMGALGASERYANFLEEYPGLEGRISQYHIASHLGISPIELNGIKAA